MKCHGDLNGYLDTHGSFFISADLTGWPYGATESNTLPMPTQALSTNTYHTTTNTIKCYVVGI